jgi:hypothetical protein
MLLDFADYADYVTYCNMRPCYGDSYDGEWYYGDDATRTLYHGTFGNDHSPGCDGRTWHQTFDAEAEYRAALGALEAIPEYVEGDGEEVEEEAESIWAE